MMVIASVFFYNLFYLMRRKYIFLAAGAISYLLFFNSTGNYWYPFFALPLFYVLFIPRIRRGMEHREPRPEIPNSFKRGVRTAQLMCMVFR